MQKQLFLQMPPKNLSFIIDTQLPPSLAIYFRWKGFNAIHTSSYKENGHLMTDKEIIEIGINESKIIITKDSDFAENYFTKGSPPKVLQLQLGNIDNRQLTNIIDKNLHSIIQLFEADSDFVIFKDEKLISYSDNKDTF